SSSSGASVFLVVSLQDESSYAPYPPIPQFTLYGLGERKKIWLVGQAQARRRICREVAGRGGAVSSIGNSCGVLDRCSIAGACPIAPPNSGNYGARRDRSGSRSWISPAS